QLGKRETRCGSKRFVGISVIVEPASTNLRLSPEEWLIVRDHILSVIHRSDLGEVAAQIGRTGRSTSCLADPRNKELAAVVIALQVQNSQSGGIDLGDAGYCRELGR